MVAEIEGLPVIKRDESHSSPRPVGGLQTGTCSMYVRACRVEDADTDLDQSPPEPQDRNGEQRSPVQV